MDKLISMGIFAKTVETGSFTATADALSMSSQLVGKHISALEHHLGVRLINRTTRQQSLTDAGQQFYERVKVILAEVDAAESFVAEARAIPRGRLKIGAPVSFGISSLAPKLHYYLEEHTEVSIELILSNRLVDLIDEGYDAIFRVGELPDSGLIAKKLAPYRLIVCAAPSYLQSSPPLDTLADLAQHNCLIFTHSFQRSKWPFQGPKGLISIPVSGRLHTDSEEALLHAVLSGAGVLMVTAELVSPYLQSGQLVEVLKNYQIPTFPMHLVYAPDRRVTPKLRSFLDFAEKYFI